MERMLKWIGKMKKSKNEGFSLVELIIVISIMAILLGVVGTQVLPYLNKSKESNDNQLLSKYHTAAVSAFAFHADIVSGSAFNFEFSATDDGSGAPAVLVQEMKTLMGVSGAAFQYFEDNATSPAGDSVTRIQIRYSGDPDGKITLQAYDGAAATDTVLKTIESK